MCTLLQGYTIPIIIATLVAAVVISSLRRPSGMSQQEIEKLLENMPPAPILKTHKRSGSDQGKTITSVISGCRAI